MLLKPFSRVILLLTLFFIYSCTSNHKTDRPRPAEPSAIQAVEINRYEKELFAINPASLKQGISALVPRFSFFLGSNWQDTLNLIRLTQYLNDSLVLNLYKIESKRFSDVNVLKTGLEDAFARIRTDFPGFRQPKVFTFISGLDVESPVICSDSIMAIGLDVFLGKDVPLYKKAGIPEYKIQRMTPEHILPACIKSVALQLAGSDIDKQAMLDKMTEAGKMLYFEDRMLPSVPDYRKIGYSEKQLEWCLTNEGNIWAFIIEKQLLYSSDPSAVNKLMLDAPFTTGLVHESPGRIGEWIGWQIVRAYMQNNPEVTMAELMKNSNSQAILTDSKYHPRK
jgi:hypothetical protein